MPHRDAVIVLSTVLRIKRTLGGVEIDKILSTCRSGRHLSWNLVALNGHAVCTENLNGGVVVAKST